MGTRKYAGVSEHYGKLRINFLFSGKRAYEVLDISDTPPNRKYAAKLVETIKDEISRGVFDYAKYFPNSPRAGRSPNTAFSKLAESWLEIKKMSTKLATYRKYDQLLNQIWLPKLGDKEIARILPSDINLALAQIDWSELSPKRWNDTLIPIRGIFESAMDDGLIKINPTTKLENKVSTPRVAQPLSQDEVTAVLVYMNKRDPQVLNIFETLFYTGMRPGELIALKWSDIDFVNSTIHIKHAKNLGVISDTKTHRARDHEAISRVMQALVRQKVHTFMKKDGFVFHHPKLDLPFHEVRPLREVYWDAALKACGLNARDFYQTRHTYITHAIMLNVNPHYISEQVGTSVDQIFRTYGKWIKKVGGSVEKQKLEGVGYASN